jgi:hypothetical protein
VERLRRGALQVSFCLGERASIPGSPPSWLQVARSQSRSWLRRPFGAALEPGAGPFIREIRVTVAEPRPFPSRRSSG